MLRSYDPAASAFFRPPATVRRGWGLVPPKDNHRD